MKRQGLCWLIVIWPLCHGGVDSLGDVKTIADIAELAKGWRGQIVSQVEQSYAGWDVEIGDADNDVEMLSYVGLPACPVDGTPELKAVVAKKGGIIATRKEYLGARQILRRIVSIRE